MASWYLLAGLDARIRVFGSGAQSRLVLLEGNDGSNGYEARSTYVVVSDGICIHVMPVSALAGVVEEGCVGASSTPYESMRGLGYSIVDRVGVGSSHGACCLGLCREMAVQQLAGVEVESVSARAVLSSNPGASLRSEAGRDL